MDNYVTLTIMNIALAAIGLGMVALGLRGLLNPRPFLLRAIWVVGPLFIAVVLSLIPGLTFRSNASNFNAGLTLLVPITVSMALLFMLVVIFIGQFGTYIIFGVKEENLREVILFALARLDIPHLEMLSRLHLPMNNADLQVISGWLGTAQMRIRPRNNAQLLDAIADEMSVIFAETKQRAVLLPSILNLIFGLLLLAATAALTVMAMS